jgi:hypothetical protein
LRCVIAFAQGDFLQARRDGYKIRGALKGSLHRRRSWPGWLPCKRRWRSGAVGSGCRPLRRSRSGSCGGPASRCGRWSERSGAAKQQLRRYVWSTGGVRSAVRRCVPRCLPVADREEISRGLARGESCRQIAGCIGAVTARCRGGPAQTAAQPLPRLGGRSGCVGVRASPEARKLATTPALRAVVEEKLKLRWSPQQIAAIGDRHARRVARRAQSEQVRVALVASIATLPAAR